MAVDEATKAFAESALDVASSLADEKAELLKKIGANRSLLRNLRDQDSLNAKQAKELEEFYPTPKRGESAENGDQTVAATTDDPAAE